MAEYVAPSLIAHKVALVPSELTAFIDTGL